MAVGCGPLIPISTYVQEQNPIPGQWGTWGQSATLSGMVQNTNLLKGGHALTSPKGGGPCPLSTLDHMVVGHLVF